LEETYGEITPEHLAENEAALSKPWDPETPTEDVFDQAREIRAFATVGGEDIPAGTVVRKLVAVFRSSGVMDEACADWDKKDTADKTLDNLRTHMRTYNTRRKSNRTTADAGYGTANAAAQQPPAQPPNLNDLVQRAVQQALGANNAGNPTNVGVEYSYCWSHGLIRNPNHTSRTCTTRAEGHQEAATLDNMMGGNNTIRRHRNECAAYRHPNRNGDQE
jgi:hypothetical protein